VRKAATNIITWILLREAKARVTEVYGSPQLAERLLIEWLADGRLRWSCKRIDATVPRWHPLATRKEGAEFWGEPEFWRDTRLYVNWEESWARSYSRYYRAWTIVVPATDLNVLLSAPAIAPPQRGKARQFDEAVRVLKELHPPSGVTPDSISTNKLRDQIEAYLQDEQKRQLQPGIPPAHIKAPSWKVVARARMYLNGAVT
jgi:hypothetical protein